MTKQAIYEKIEAYLDGSLQGEALAAFEKELQHNPTLAKKVALHRKLQNELGDPIKRQLRGILADLKNQENSADVPVNVRQLQPRNSHRKWLAIAASFLILAAASWYFLFNSPPEAPLIVDGGNAPVEQIEPSISQEKIPEKSPVEIKKENPQDAADLAEQSDSKPAKPLSTTPPTQPLKPTETPTNDPFLASAEIESLLAALPATPFEFVVDFPEKNDVLTIRTDGKVQFGLLATLFSSQFPEEDNFVLQLFDNQEGKFKSGNPIFQTKLTFEKEESQRDLAYAAEERSIYYVNFRERIVVSPGLYYWAVALEKKGTIAFSGKIEIKQRK